MYSFMTTGTTHFLKNITDQYPDIPFHFMRSGASTLAYYEGEQKKGIFVSGRSYEILHQFGDVEKKGFVVMQSIPVTEDGKKIFEERAKSQFSMIEKSGGLVAARLLKQLKGLQYIIFTQWKTEQDYALWQRSDSYKEAGFSNLARLPAYFSERPFTSTYIMLKDEEA